MVDHHPRLAAGDLFDLLDGGHVHGDVLAAGGFGVVGGQLGGLGDGVVRRDLAAAGDDDVAAVDLGGVAPDIVLPGQLEGQLIVLAVVPAHIDGKAVGAFKALGGKLAGFHPLPVGVHADIAAGIELLTDLFQLRVLLGPVQFLQDAFQIA